ncbi:hypothetical protein [Angustibacter luteus]|uniref:hypothetical protein n=1 Tax=Angustibacter luteus TaxID=658456 RepID=UPI0036703C22
MRRVAVLAALVLLPVGATTTAAAAPTHERAAGTTIRLADFSLSPHAFTTRLVLTVDDAAAPPTHVRRAVPLYAAVVAARRSARVEAAKAKATHEAAVKAKAKAKAARAKASAARPSGGGGSSSLQQAISRIPGYAAHRPANWISTGRYGHYGATDLASNNVYINPGVPSSVLDAVVRHEWSHILSVRAYGGSYPAMMSATNRVFGGSGMTGAERAADCMAIQLGASWTHYTSCSNSHWRAAATRLLSGRRL